MAGGEGARRPQTSRHIVFEVRAESGRIVSWASGGGTAGDIQVALAARQARA